MTTHTLDVLIIGAGAAGARAAIEIEQQTDDVEQLVIGKQDHGDAHTTWARGGINAALGNIDWQDTWQIHAADTLKEGHFICDPTAVENVTKQMPDRVNELDDWGMDFTKTEDELINQRFFGAQSFRRTCYAGDHTGESMLNTLVEKAQSLDIPYEERVYIQQLVAENGRIRAAIGIDLDTGEKAVYYADHIVLATGGYSGVYGRHSSRDEENNGDSVRLAMSAGAEVQDMEFVQFHPTGMSGYGEEWQGRLVTEAVRGEGGKLYNADGERFMEEYSPKSMELDARDVVARAIQSEVDAGRGTENDAVYLDISERDRDFLEEHLPRMTARFDELGVDLSETAVEVAPTAHYSMGGVRIDWDTGETCVENLYAIGEAAAGVHGANRLGGNSLAETVAMGQIVGEEISSRPIEDVNEDVELPQMNEYVVSDNCSDELQELDATIRETMDEHGNLRRDANSIERGLTLMTEHLHDLLSLEPSTTADYEVFWNCMSMVATGRIVLDFALKREESRGAHYRTDFTDTEEQFRFNYVTGTSDAVKRSDIGSISDEVQDAIDEGHELDYVQLE
jgi:succinate dehydrogenase / fumarate reductase flavoprotein subunit